MTRREIASAVAEIVAAVLSEHVGLGDVIKCDAKLHDELGMDEADVIEVMLRAEERFGINLPDNHIGFSSTVTEIVDIVTTRLRDKESRERLIQTPPRLASPSIAPEAGNDIALNAGASE